MSSARSRSTHPDAVDVIIDQWKRELPELASENMALIGRLRRCSILLAPRLDEVFAAYDLSNGAFDVLATLRARCALYSDPDRAFCIAHGYFRHYDNPPAECAEAGVG